MTIDGKWSDADFVLDFDLLFAKKYEILFLNVGHFDFKILKFSVKLIWILKFKNNGKTMAFSGQTDHPSKPTFATF